VCGVAACKGECGVVDECGKLVDCYACTFDKSCRYLGPGFSCIPKCKPDPSDDVECTKAFGAGNAHGFTCEEPTYPESAGCKNLFPEVQGSNRFCCPDAGP
jgi:hypothetical protein